MRNPIRLRTDHKLMTTTYGNEIAKELNNDVAPAMHDDLPSTEGRQAFIAVPIEALDGAGKYRANILMLSVVQDAEEVFESEDVTRRNYPVYIKNAILANLAEEGVNGNTLPLDKPVICYFSGFTDGGACFTTHLRPAGFFPVLLVQDGGTDGGAITQASWTYSVFPLDAGYSLGTGIAVYRPRPNGKMVYQGQVDPMEGDRYFGVAFYDIDGTLKLWDAGEIPATLEQSCEPEV